MSDLELRLALRAYEADPSYENAAIFIRLYQRTGSETDWIGLRQGIDRQLEREGGFHDMATLTFDLTQLWDDDTTYQESRTARVVLSVPDLVDWVESVASFSHNSEYNWEHIVYLGGLYDLAEDTNPGNFAMERRENSRVIIPTPPILIPIIEEALRLGAWYIAFNSG